MELRHVDDSTDNPGGAAEVGGFTADAAENEAAMRSGSPTSPSSNLRDDDMVPYPRYQKE
jgi:hypothetical protein